MAPEARDLGGPIAVVNRFTVKGDADQFEREFLRHTGLLGSQEDADIMATFRVVDRPKVYVHFGFWRKLSAFLEAVHDEAFLRQAERLGSMVEAHADQAVSVGKVSDGGDPSRATAIILTQYRVSGNCRAFERALWERADQLLGHGGPGGTQLLRSVMRPQDYVSIEWGEDSELFQRVRNGRRYRELEACIADVAEMRAEESRYVAHQPV